MCYIIVFRVMSSKDTRGVIKDVALSNLEAAPWEGVDKKTQKEFKSIW